MAAQSDFLLAVHQIASERGIDASEVLSAVEESIVAAYKRDYEYSEEDEIKAQINENGKFSIVVNGKDSTPQDFGRIASQTAKQVILQKVSEAEKDSMMNQIEDRIGSIEMATVQRFDGQNVIVEVGKLSAVLPPQEQIFGEILKPGNRVKVYLKEIQDSPTGGRKLIVSRSSDLMVRSLFENEVPEIASGTVEIKAISREAGYRTKVAVFSDTTGIDPIGACVGQRGMRIIAMTNELGNEKIDVIQWDPDIQKFIKNSLSPAKPITISMDEANRSATVVVSQEQLSLAIGKEGQNVRLAAKLTGWSIDIVADELFKEDATETKVEDLKDPDVKEMKKKRNASKVVSKVAKKTVKKTIVKDKVEIKAKPKGKTKSVSSTISTSKKTSKSSIKDKGPRSKESRSKKI
ncbi:MAG: transcription termination factor NusA [Patescibacteria group bacterium]